MPLAERTLIERIRRRAGPARRRAMVTGGPTRLSVAVVTELGDDCAVLRPASGVDLLVTTDFSLEGVHFRREWHPAEAVGHRCLARGLSDIAAMGGEPVAAFLSLAVPGDLPQRWVDGFLAGLLRLARRFGVSLAGGDLAQSPAAVLADIQVIGMVPAGEAVLRSGARPGDRIYVTGDLGAAAATLARLLANPGRRLRAHAFPAHFRPEPQVKAGLGLRERRLASAMIDISDGLSVDLAHICDESGAGAEVVASALPLARVGGRAVERRFALHGGDDYQLLFTAPPAKKVPRRVAGVPISEIGRIVRGRRLTLLEDSRRTELKPEGWEHFGKQVVGR